MLSKMYVVVGVAHRQICPCFSIQKAEKCVCAVRVPSSKQFRNHFRKKERQRCVAKQQNNNSALGTILKNENDHHHRMRVVRKKNEKKNDDGGCFYFSTSHTHRTTHICSLLTSRKIYIYECMYICFSEILCIFEFKNCAPHEVAAMCVRVPELQ